MERNLRRGIHALMCALSVYLVLAVTACKDSNPTGAEGSPSDVVFPADSVSYSRHLQPLFNQACALSGCHSAGESSDRVHLDSWANLMFGVNGLHVVNPGSPDNSELVLRIEGRSGQRMPIGMNPLNQNQITGIRKWISEGARNN